MFSKFSVKKPFTVFVAIIIVIILGVVSWTKMTVDLIPSLNLPYAVIVTTLPGASPEEIESTISAPLESTLATISNIDEIQSVSTNSVSMVMLQFLGDTNMDSAMIEMREQIDMYTAMPTYPENAGSPMIIKVNMNLLPVEVITASMKGMNEIEANKYVEDKILPEIESVEGVASVTATGLLKNMVDVTISKSKLETLQKSIEEKLQAAVLEQITAQVEPVVEEQVRVAVEEQVKAGLAASGVTEITPGYENLLIQAVDEALPSAVEAAMPAAIEAALAEFENSDDAKAMSDITSNINTDMISGILTAENFSMPAGSVLDTAGFSYSVKVGDKYSSIDEFKQQTLFNVPN
ncbi:MAG: efflux RND transporter permease subunit, partial [Oscillospiraceae bacterium]|nr:efflux RND transporter permease subunit [Oscillospiraceae bacterium]